LKILSVVGARPNFMKIAPFVRAIESARRGPPAACLQHVLVHTGQHYAPDLSAGFFEQLGIPAPDVNLGVGSGPHGYQIGRTMIEFEPVLLELRPDWVVVVGDVNATAACSIVARKHGVAVAHIEAGLRSFDWEMPEEINRVITDRVSNLLFTTDHTADQNLVREGVPAESIVRVGNVMIDTLEHERESAAGMDVGGIVRRYAVSREHADAHESALRSGAYSVLTLHRPANVDAMESWQPLIAVLCEVAAELPMVFPIHPRTRLRLEEFGLWESFSRNRNVVATAPLGYREMLRLIMGARIVLTDSGGLQEETLVLGKPCLTLRWNTERPITLVENGGTNRLAGNDPALIRRGFRDALAKPCEPARPALWDGHAATRIVTEILRRSRPLAP